MLLALLPSPLDHLRLDMLPGLDLDRELVREREEEVGRKVEEGGRRERRERNSRGFRAGRTMSRMSSLYIA